MSGFSILVFVLVMSLYCGVLFKSIAVDVMKFFAMFIPAGTPLWIAPLVCLAETVSFVLRPFVLVLRPIINLRIGVSARGFIALRSIKVSR